MNDVIAKLIADTSFWVMLSTVLCFAFIAIKSRGAVAAGLAARTEAIRQRLEEAETLRREAEAMLATMREKSEKAMQEAEFIVQNAHRRAEQMREEMEEETRNVIAREELKAKNRISRMEEETVRAVKDRIITLALDQVKTSVANDVKIKPSIDASMNSIKDVLQK